MNLSLLQIVLSMLVGILAIILLTTRFRLPAFFAILIACFITGIGLQMPLPAIISTARAGFGHTMQSLGFIIVLGTLLGLLLESTGCTRVMAAYILRKTGEKNASFAIALTGFIVGLPVFCDSGYIVLSGLNKSMIRRSGISAITMTVSLASGLYVVHCLLPPHPGAAAAADAIGVDLGKLILYGIIIAFPVMLVAHQWAKYIGRKLPHVADEPEEPEIQKGTEPSVLRSFLPVIVPLILITARSFFIGELKTADVWMSNLFALGDPVMALIIGVLLALFAKPGWRRNEISKILHDALEKAGTILLIIGTGGAFGAILASTNIGDFFAGISMLGSIGLLFPFLIAVVLKTAQGSSTVAIITSASIVLPLLPSLQLDSENGRIIAVLAMGAGSMMISHANDAYFWVIARFSGLGMKTMLRAYSTVSIIMGLLSIFLTWILSLFLI